MDTSISPSQFNARASGADAPMVLDVREPAAYAASRVRLQGAVYCAPQDLDRFIARHAPRPIVVYCVHGHQLSADAVARLRAAGWPAAQLQGGIEGGEDGVDDPALIAAWRAQAPLTEAKEVAPIPFRQALAFWFKLGCISFGGPAGQIAIMHRELVVQKRWVSDQRFLHALNYCMLLPGPEAQQLATYLGWLMHRTWGGIVAGALFVLPSFVLLMLLSWIYVAYGDLPWIAGIFYGVKPAVAALVLQAVQRIGARTLKTPLLWAIAVVSFAAIAFLHAPFPLVVLLAALTGFWGRRAWPAQFASATDQAQAAQAAHAPAWIDDDTPTPAHARFSAARLRRLLLVGALLWLLPMAALWAWQSELAQMGWFFTKAALLTFGGAYAVLPYVYQGAVEQFQWLTAAQMMDGLGLGETTPGPLIIVVSFVGFIGGWTQQMLGPEQRLAGALLASLVVTWFTFLPSFVFILAGGPWVESTRGKLAFTAPLTAITAAVVGVMASLALFFAAHIAWSAAGPDIWAIALALLAAVSLMRYGASVVTVILGCGAAGLALRLLGLN